MNKLRLLNILVIIFLLPIVICCKQESVKPIKYQKQVNFIILLDLSDRIIKSNDQVNRDIKIIENIFYLFEKEVQKKAYIKSKDQFQIIISYQKNSTIDKNEYEDKFYINLKNEKIATKRKKVLQVSKNLHNNLVDLYKNAKFSSKPEDYSGADIWKYFNEDLKSDLITTTDAKNILVIISDGQLIVNGKDRVSVNQSIQQVDNEFNNLSVALLEIVPSETDNGYSQLIKGWHDWFETMKIYNSYFDKKVSINNVNDGLKTYIEDCISHKGDFEKKNVEKFKKKKIKIISIKKPSTEKLVNVKKGFKEKKEIVLRNLVNYSSSSFKYYNSIKTLDEKTKFAISNIINLNESKYTTSELKIIASDLYKDLILNFPTKNQITKYSYCCSSKEKIKSFLEEYNFYTKDIEQNFKTNCPK